MRPIQWSLGTLACFAMVMSPMVQPCLADGSSAAPTSASSSPIAAAQQSPNTSGNNESKSTNAVDLSYIPESAVAAVVLHPRPLFTGTYAEILPVEIITAWGLQNLGFDPAQIEEIVLIGAPPEISATTQSGRPRSRAPGFGAVLHFAEPYSSRDAFAKLKTATYPMVLRIAEVEGKKFALIPSPTPVGVYYPDDRTIVVGSDGLLQQMMTASAVDSNLTQLLRATDCSGTATVLFSLDAVRGLVDRVIANVPPLPPATADLLKIPKLISSGVVRLDLRDSIELSVTLHTADAASADQLKQLIEQGLELAHRTALANFARQQASTDDPVQQAMQKYSLRMSERTYKSLKPTRDGADVKWSLSGKGNPLIYTAAIGVLVALLLPAVVAAREAAHRNLAQAKMKQVGLAILNYEAAYGRFPARAVFKDGKPLLSWRVMVLPYLQDADLYKDFHLDESWDSPHNKALISRMPSVFSDPDGFVSGTTHFVVPVGKGLMFDGDKTVRLADIANSASTIMLAEADKSVVWTKPEDLDVNLQEPMSGLGHVRPNGFFALFADDHTSLMSDTTDPAHLRHALELNSHDARADNDSGISLVVQGRLDPAIEEFRHAIKLDPNMPSVHYNLATALARRGDIDEAIDNLKRELAIQPNSEPASKMLAAVLSNREHVAQALKEINERLKETPKDPDLLEEGAWIMATSPYASIRNGADSVRRAELAWKITGGDDPQSLGTLAAAYAEAGRFDDAVMAAKRGIGLANARNATALADQIAKCLAMYRSKKPFRDVR